jgi:hypothetical protein
MRASDSSGRKTAKAKQEPNGTIAGMARSYRWIFLCRRASQSSLSGVDKSKSWTQIV